MNQNKQICESTNMAAGSHQVSGNVIHHEPGNLHISHQLIAALLYQQTAADYRTRVSILLLKVLINSCQRIIEFVKLTTIIINHLQSQKKQQIPNQPSGIGALSHC